MTATPREIAETCTKELGLVGALRYCRLVAKVGGPLAQAYREAAAILLPRFRQAALNAISESCRPAP